MEVKSRSRFKGLTDFALLFRGNIIEFRQDWVWHLAYGSFYSIMFLVFLWLSGGRGNPESALYIITGSLTQTLTTQGMLTLGQQIGSMKNSSIFDHYATLPISKVSFIAAMVSKSMLFSLPSLAMSLLFAAVVLKITVHLTLYVVLAILFGGYSLIGIGAIVGFYSKTGRVAGLATQYLGPVITFLAPVFVPMEALPRFLQVTSTILPTTYVARAFRGAVSGQSFSALSRDFMILALWIVGSLALVFPRLDWRGRKG